MDLSQIADISSIVTSLATVLIAVWVFRWSYRSEKNNQRRHSNNEMQTYNLAVLEDKHLLRMEAENHPFGNGDMDVDGARKMYRYFLWINVSDNLRKAAKDGLLDKDHAEARFLNMARIALPDREFLETHVFPRGYEADLIEAIRKRWKQIEREDRPGP